MELAAIHLARAMAYVETIDLNPKGKAYFPDLVKALVSRFHFEKFPQKPEEFDDGKGIVFAEGKFDGTVLDQLIIYRYGIVVDTRVSTKESKRLLEDALKWANSDLGLVNKPIDRWQYASQITFYSEVALSRVHSAYQRLADSTAANVSEMFAENIKYELMFISIDHDPLTRKHPIGRFSIQRRENVPFSQNKYFSDAPLPTDIHLKLLERFEADLAGT
jgi:hypothetical protein